MLAERALLWKQEYIQQGRLEGISIGEAIGEARGEAIGEARGIGLALRDVLEARFGALPQEVVSAIEASADSRFLRKLTLSAFQTPSLEAFLKTMKD